MPLDNQTQNLPNPSSTSNISFSMGFLCKLIPQGFDGDRYELGAFLANCNNANKLATEEQKLPLHYFILSRISGRAKQQLAQQTFNNWEELKNKLKILYQDKKHYVQIMEDLNNCKQNYNESISEFYQKLEILNSRALSAAQQYTKKTEDLSGRLETINEITLNIFIYHSLPNISQMLRWKDFENLNSAYSAALAEERATNIHKQKFCKTCKKSDHDTSQCRFKPKFPQRTINNIQNTHTNFQNKFNSNNNNSNNAQMKFCNYCKTRGHEIQECRKRMFNNARKTNGIPATSQNQQSIHLNSQQSVAENTTHTDQIQSLMVFQE